MSTELTKITGPADFDLRSGAVFAQACTHCGLCLESCPTYTLWGTETDSPRGRIVQIEDAIRTGGSVSDQMSTHIDSCVGCLACISACPEGVRYDELLGRARVAVQRQRELPVVDRFRRRLRLEARVRSGRVRDLAGVSRIPHFTPSQGPPRGRVGLLLGCTQRATFEPIHQATVALLAAEGYEVIAPTLPDCCGALDFAGGHLAQAIRRAESTIAAFAAVGGVDHVIISAGTCGAAAKRYGDLLGTPAARAFSALVLDVHELLIQSEPRAARGALSLRVAYHDSCQLRYGQGITEAPRVLLRAIPGLSLIELPAEVGACCGGACDYPVRLPEAAAELGARQARAVTESGAELLVSGDHHCISQLLRALAALRQPLAVHHPVELLWRSVQAGASN